MKLSDLRTAVRAEKGECIMADEKKVIIDGQELEGVNGG